MVELRQRIWCFGMLTVLLLPLPLFAQAFGGDRPLGTTFSEIFFPERLFGETAISNMAFSDTVSQSKVRTKYPKVAGLCSIIPGGGQVYNGKYWKVPVVYAALGVTGGMTYHYHQKYIYYRDEYRLRLNGATEGLNPDLASMSDENVHAYESYYRRNQELGLFVFILCYGLNIVDAVVDAHFSTFDISDDLTLQLQPSLTEPLPRPVPTATTFGMRLVLNF
ncbi:MAG: hypothetical protein J5792_03690 [Bacteroidales bacterium]|nr:hypothetical protein [Bacteroidales bacterium]